MVTLKETSERIFLEVFRCPHCQEIIGSTTNTTLYIGPAMFERTVTFKCGYCKKSIRWGIDTEVKRKNN